MEVETNEFGLVSVSLRQKIRGCEIRSKKWLIYRSPLITFCLGIYSIYQYIYGDNTPSGYTSIILFVSFSFTLLFSILSIQLLYFEKLIEEIRQTPIYIVENKQRYDK